MKRRILGTVAAAAALGSVAAVAPVGPVAPAQAAVVGRVCLAFNGLSVGVYINDFTVGQEVPGNPRMCFKF
ncbi:MAG: hypothetical protein QOI61_1145 [Actinomycetota bacterium]|jgi:hypothetical protein